MKILKNLFRTLILAIPLCILLHSNSFAMTQAEAGNYIASYAMNFYNSSLALMVVYDKDYHIDDPASWQRRATQVNSGRPWESGQYVLECVGFSSMVIKQATGLTSDAGDVEDGRNGFIMPNVNDDTTFEQVSDMQPGDILTNSHHVMVYVGNGMIVHCDGGYKNRSRSFKLSNSRKLW